MRTRVPASLVGPTALALTLLAAGASVLWLSQQALDQRRTELAQARAARDAADNRLRHAAQTSAATRHAAARVQSLRPGPDDRTAMPWRSAVDRLDTDRQLLRVEIRPGEATLHGGEHDALPMIRVQRLTLNAELVHEGGLGALIDALSADPGATLIPLACSIERQTSGRAPLRAQCEVDWLTLHPRPQPRS